ncbi:MAG: LL-diaminopimelate aminotransferase [Elusimicrobia bacterium]|nr:LL-diaminopimelate aminotransferase [Elusimicrobiota bacterium]
MESVSEKSKEITVSDRLKKLPPYLFVDLDRKKEAKLKEGADIIHLGIGDPDLPTPKFLVEAAAEALKKKEHHRYPLGKGSPELRETIAEWYQKRFAVRLDPNSEILVLIGSKEGIGHIPIALTDPGDIVLVPDPGYPPYRTGTLLAGAEPHLLPLNSKNGFLPDLTAIKGSVLKKAKLLFLNYPNNPTGAVASLDFFQETTKWAHKNSVWVAHDAAYSEMYFDPPSPSQSCGDLEASETRRPPSFLQAQGGKEIGVEFHSLSKTFNMTGWRVGWVCGNAKVISALSQVKDNYDSGVFGAIQETAIQALKFGEKAAEEMRKTYRARRETFVEGLKKLGWNVLASQSTFYIWTRTPHGWSSQETCEKLLEEASLIATPGDGFGPNGEGFIRFTLTVPEPRLQEALERLSKIK